MSLSISDLFSPQTVEQIKATSYGIMTSLGLSTTTWREGDPSRTIVAVLGTMLSQFTTMIAKVAASGFLDFATGPGLTLLADQAFDVQREPASYATGFETFNNAGGGSFSFGPDEVTLKNSTTGATFRNAEAFTLGPSEMGKVVAIKAVEIGSGGSSAAGAVDELVTTLLGVTVSNASVLVGVDEETDANLRIRCRDKLKALSPMGPRAVYDYVARSTSLNGGVHVTRTQIVGDSDFGTVAIYIADEDGAISPGDVALVQSGIDVWATPIAIEAEVFSATGVTVDVDVSVWILTSSGLTDEEIETRIEDALAAFFEASPLGGYVLPPEAGKLYVKSIEDAVARALPEAFLVTVTDPAAAVALGEGVVAALGTVTPTITRIAA